MSPTPPVSSFVADRFEQLLWNTLPSRGFLFTPESRDPSEYADDPPLGRLRVKAVWVPNADDDEDADGDPSVTVSLEERWSEEAQADATEERGIWRVAYSYHGQIGDKGFRYDYDPEGHPECPYHLHPFGRPNAVREPAGPVSIVGAG